jgi:hypothetical protein
MTSEWSFVTKGKNTVTDTIGHWIQLQKCHIGSTKELNPTPTPIA